MIEKKTTVLVICMHKPVESIVYAVPKDFAMKRV